jgi:hypothetical protein
MSKADDAAERKARQKARQMKSVEDLMQAQAEMEADRVRDIVDDMEPSRDDECPGITLYGLTTMSAEGGVCHDPVYLDKDWINERIAARTLNLRCFGLTECSPAYDELPKRWQRLFSPTHP